LPKRDHFLTAKLFTTNFQDNNNQTMAKLALVALLVAVAVVLVSSLVSGMAARDAFEEARRFHKNDPNFADNYNVAQDHMPLPHTITGGFAAPPPHMQAPVFTGRDGDMPHAPGGDFL
jgi:hypothetical protein